MSDTFSIDAQLKCVQREIEMREQVYARRVREGKMNEHHARHEIECMRAVLLSLIQLAHEAPPKLSRGR